MRPKSVQKFQDKVRQLTPRHSNLEAPVIEKLNPVIRGTALYFTPPWATTRWKLGRLDSWLRRRLRAMGSKGKRLTDNYRLPNRKLAQLGLIRLTSFCGNRT
jgi:RNA-directed DNA polymerase